MTVSGTTTKVSYACNGSTIIFPVTFEYVEPTDIKVILRKESDGSETALVYHTDFDVPVEGEDNYGNVVLIGDYALTPPATGYTLLVKRELSLTQLFEYIEGDSFPAASHEEALDRLVMLCQQILEILNRAPVMPETATDTLVMPEPVANKRLGYDADGNLALFDP